MAYDTKLMIGLIAKNIAKSKTLKEAYMSVADAANAEGVNLKSYEEALEEIEELRKEVK